MLISKISRCEDVYACSNSNMSLLFVVAFVRRGTVAKLLELATSSHIVLKFRSKLRNERTSDAELFHQTSLGMVHVSKGKRWNAQALMQVGIAVRHWNIHKLHIGKGVGHAIKQRSHGLAGSAPRGKESDRHHFVCLISNDQFVLFQSLYNKDIGRKISFGGSRFFGLLHKASHSLFKGRPGYRIRMQGSCCLLGRVTSRCWRRVLFGNSAIPQFAHWWLYRGFVGHFHGKGRSKRQHHQQHGFQYHHGTTPTLILCYSSWWWHGVRY